MFNIEIIEDLEYGGCVGCVNYFPIFPSIIIECDSVCETKRHIVSIIFTALNLYN